MKQLEKNVYFDDIKTVYVVCYMSCDGDDIFLTKEDAIEYINKYKKELLEEYDEEWLEEEGLDGNAEDYIEERELGPDERAATNEYGDVVVEQLRFGKWEEEDYC